MTAQPRSGSSASTPSLLCIAGPTASGKSAIARTIAQQWPCEIINVDSATIYRGMDIGTAKPTRQERATISHHLLDILDPLKSYSAAAFRRDALVCVQQIRARGRLPLLVGGTMLYFKALREGLNDLPSANAELRKELEAHAAQRGWPAMHAWLREIDPVTAARLSPNDSQRIQRALEIWHLSGQPMSELLSAPQQSDQPLATMTLSLEPVQRGNLHERIAFRFDEMLKEGLVEEVRTLRARGDLHIDLPSVRCVGYRQLWSMLEGETTLDQAREQAIAATRQLAKRQLTWLRSLPDRLTVEADAPDALERALTIVAHLIDERMIVD